jgi:hypothetical protein
MVNFLKYVASHERKRRANNREQERKQQKRKPKKMSFVSSSVPKPVGTTVAITKSKVLKRMSKHESVLHKHVKWLKELEEEKRRLQEKKEAEEIEKAERKRSFIERDTETIEEFKSSKKVDGGLPLATNGANSTTPALAVSDSVKIKPAWCQSEASREASEIDAEMNLLSFVESLDFDQYTQDLELQALIGQVKERIKTLEREKKKDETKLRNCLDVSSLQSCLRYGFVQFLNTTSYLSFLP